MERNRFMDEGPQHWHKLIEKFPFSSLVCAVSYKYTAPAQETSLPSSKKFRNAAP